MVKTAMPIVIGIAVFTMIASAAGGGFTSSKDEASSGAVSGESGGGIMPIVIGIAVFTMIAVSGIIFYFVKVLPGKMAGENMLMNNQVNATTHNDLFAANEEPNPYMENSNAAMDGENMVIGAAGDKDLFSPIRF